MIDRSQRPALVPLLLGLALSLFLFGCGSDDGDSPTTTASTTTEADPTTDSSDPSDPSDPVSTDDTGDPDDSDDDGEQGDGSGDDGDDGAGDTGGGDAQPISPGAECDLDAGIPDCIDPDGDGVGVYLIDGDLCASTAPDISACEDADGDGVAGGEDEYSDLPTCGPDVAPPCNNPPGAHED